MYEDKLSSPMSTCQEVPKKESEIAREIGAQNMIINDLGDAFGRLVDRISPVLRQVDSAKDCGIPENIVMTDVGRAISENNKKLMTLMEGIRNVRSRVEV